MGAGTAPGGATSGRRRRVRRRHQPMAEINVTPFVDVMLVLLIIFMVAAPLLTVGVPIDLPQTQAKPMEGNTNPLQVAITEEGLIFIQEEEIAEDELVAKLKALAKQGVEDRIYVSGAGAADYGTVARVLGLLNAAGFRSIGLVTDQETET